MARAPNLTDEDGLDGPFDKAMKESIADDARAFNRHAGAVARLIDVDIPVQPQHLRRPRKGTPACGATTGLFFASSVYGVTCEACKEVLARKVGR